MTCGEGGMMPEPCSDHYDCNECWAWANWRDPSYVSIHRETLERVRETLLMFNRDRRDYDPCVCDPTGEGGHKANCPQYRDTIADLDRLLNE